MRLQDSLKFRRATAAIDACACGWEADFAIPYSDCNLDGLEFSLIRHFEHDCLFAWVASILHTQIGPNGFQSQ